MNIFLDNIIFSMQKTGGISAYWYELITRLLQDKTNIHNTFLEYDNAESNIFRQKVDLTDNHIQLFKSSAAYFRLGKYLPIWKKTKVPCIFHSSYYRYPFFRKTSVKEVVTVHDFTYERYPDSFSKLNYFLRTRQKKKAIARASAVICVSESTKKDLLSLYPQFSNKDIHVIYNGISNDYYPIEKKENTNPYILFVGARNKYKNFNFSVQFINLLKEYKLYIVGAALSPTETLFLNETLGERWQHFPNISNERLNELYNNAVCLLYPSSYEGFGIPVGEAMKSGCPVLTLNNSSLPEVCGDAGIMVEELDLNLFLEKFQYMTANRDTIIANGFKHVAQFSWDKCYEETLKIYQHLML